METISRLSRKKATGRNDVRNHELIKVGKMNIKSVLRWCAMPFAAIIGAFIAYALISLWIRGNNFGFEIYNGVEVGSITQIILAIIAQAALGAAFVFCGALVAPSHRRICAIVLATIISVIVVISAIASIIMNGFLFMQLAHNIATVVGSILAIQVVEDEIINNETID